MKTFSEYIKENPDASISSKGMCEKSDPNSFIFMYYKNNFYIEKSSKTHIDMVGDIEKVWNENDKLEKVWDTAYEKEYIKCSGIIWKDKQHLSFHIYPKTKNELNNLIKKLNIKNNYTIDIDFNDNTMTSQPNPNIPIQPFILRKLFPNEKFITLEKYEKLLK